MRAISRTELKTKNKVIALNTLAIAIMTYSFYTIKWILAEMKKMDTKVWN